MVDITERLAIIHLLDRVGQDDVAREAAETIYRLRRALGWIKDSNWCVDPLVRECANAALEAGTGKEVKQ